MKLIIVLYSILIFCFFSCNNVNKKNNVIARVGNSYLYEEELIKKMPVNFNKEDSTLFRSNYINSWAIEQLLLEKARINIQDEKDKINELVRTYEKELLIDKYKQAIVQQEIDTTITDEEITIYYTKNKNIFKLNDNLIQLKYIYYNKDINGEKEVKRLFKSDDKDDISDLIDRELEFNSFNFNDSIWIRLNAVLKKLPILKDVTRLKKNDFIQKEDSLGVYLVAVKDVLNRNQIAPKSYVIPTIRQMILHKRKLELIKKIEITLVNDAISNKQFEQYGND